MEFVPSNIIKTPDFGAMAENAMQQKRQNINEMNSWMDSNKKKEGAYLEGDKPAVQDAWNKYQEELDSAVESGNRGARRKADEAYGAYAQLAGTAMTNADQYRSQVAAYKSDPSKYSIGGQEFLSLSDEYRRTKRNANDIVSAVQNPFVIAQSMKYDLSNPLDQAGKMIQMSSAKIKDFYDDKGNLDAESLRKYAEELATASINANEFSVEKAMAWGGVRNGYAGGEDGIINSMEELEFLRNQPDEKREEFIDSYKNELVNNYIKLLPSQKTEDSSGKKKLATDTVSLQAAGGEDVNFITLPGDVNGITQIGSSSNGQIFITVEERVKTGEIDDRGNEVYETKVEYRPATQTEVSKILSKYGNTYDLSGLNVRPQQAPKSTAEEPATETPEDTEQPTGKPKDTLGLGIFDEPTEESDPNAPPLTEEPRVAFQQGDDASAVDETVVEEAPEESPVDTKSGDYIVIGGKAYFKDDYKKVAGKRTGRGNYPETFEDYAKSMDVDIANTKNKPITNTLDEVTVTADRIDPPISKENVTPIQGGGKAPAKNKEEGVKVDEVQYTPQQWSEAKPSQEGNGKRNQETSDLKKIRYIPRRVIPVSTEYVEGSGVPVPQNEKPSSTSAQPYYINNTGNRFQVSEGFEWTPETVKKAMNRWNTNIPVDPKLFIKASNRFGIPVELMIAMAAQEGSIGVGDRQVRTKNFFNWGNTTEGDNLPAGLEQDKYNTYYQNWEDGVMHWADGMARRYRPKSGDWSELWSSNKSFVDKDGERYATGRGYEKSLREIIEYSIPKQFNDRTYREESK
tara:strand:+ start:7000 stop:9393 length:2394 start_codon:yes stop_codon:yes gene_type:complete